MLIYCLGFTLKGSSDPLVVPLGGSVVLPCSVDSLLPLEDLEVEWRRSDTQTLIHLYQDGDIRPEAQHQDYHDRAHFFTEDIKHGNFSLLLNNLTAEDEGKYTCKVYSGKESGESDVDIKHVERLIVSGSSLSVSASVGDDVTLSCSVDSHIKPEEIEEVSWRKTDKNEPITVLLYQNNETLPGSSDEGYKDRVEFFTDEIHRGNFSLRLKRVRTEDKGVYVCQVFSGRLSANTTVKLERLAFSGFHIMVLILCITACGSALLFCGLIYCRPNTGLIVEGDYDFFMGGSVVLPCFVDPHLITKDLKVKWRRSGLKSPVCVYKDGDISPEAQHQDYHDRAHFFTEDIKHGNFSLLLKNVREEDLGEYTCNVYRHSAFSCSVSLLQDEEDFFAQYSCDLVVLPGGSVVMPFFTDPSITTEGLKVEWRRSDTDTLIHLYEGGNIRPESQHQDYHYRANFFTEDIKHGNFSILLNNLTAEDEGQYTCTVYTGQHTAFSTGELVPRQLDSVFHLQTFLVFCPNLIMFLAFIFWGVSEGSVNETIFCCALYILRPFMLLFAAPYIKEFTGNNFWWLNNYGYRTEYIVLSTVLYSVLFYSSWGKGLSFAGFEGVMMIILFGIVLLFCLFFIIFALAKISGKVSERITQIFNVLSAVIRDVLPSLQFILLFYMFGSAGGGFFIVAVLPVITTTTNYDWNFICGQKMGCSPLVRRSVWSTMMLLLTAVMMYFYIMTLENEKDRVGWACMIGFLQVLWLVWNCLMSFQDWEFTRITAVYVFGSVVVVLISAVALMIELILKTVYSESSMGDLRIIVFSSEIIFTVSVLMLIIFAPWIKKDLQYCQIGARCKQKQDNTSDQHSATAAAGSDETQASGSNQNTAESHEMKSLLKTEDQDAGGAGSTAETQLDSVKSQT